MEFTPEWNGKMLSIPCLEFDSGNKNMSDTQHKNNVRFTRKLTKAETTAYIKAVVWIALNDETFIRNCEVISQFPTVLLVSDTFDAINSMVVATDVLNMRQKLIP